MSLVETAAFITNVLVLVLLLVSMLMSVAATLLLPAALIPSAIRDRDWREARRTAGIFVAALFVLIFSTWAFDNAPAWAWSEHIQAWGGDR